MNYTELIEKAMSGRKTKHVADEWGINNMTLGRYVSGQRMPDHYTALRLVKAAGISTEEGFEILAAEERRRQVAKIKKEEGFASPMLLVGIGIAGAIAASAQHDISTISNAALIGGVVLSFCLYYVKSDGSTTVYVVVLVLTTRSHPAWPVH